MVWLEVRILSGPPRSPMRTDVSRSPTNSAYFAGIFAGSNAGRAVSAAGRDRDSVDFGSRSLGSANPFLAPAGVAHEDRQVQIDKPNIAYWRDHSAGASRRRVTPIPRGEIAPELTGHGLPLSKCEAYNRVYEAARPLDPRPSSPTIGRGSRRYTSW